MFGGKLSLGNIQKCLWKVRIPVKDHKSPLAAVMICATLVNTQTAFDQCTISSVT